MRRLRVALVIALSAVACAAPDPPAGGAARGPDSAAAPAPAPPVAAEVAALAQASMARGDTAAVRTQLSDAAARGLEPAAVLTILRDGLLPAGALDPALLALLVRYGLEPGRALAPRDLLVLADAAGQIDDAEARGLFVARGRDTLQALVPAVAEDQAWHWAMLARVDAYDDRRGDARAENARALALAPLGGGGDGRPVDADAIHYFAAQTACLAGRAAEASRMLDALLATPTRFTRAWADADPAFEPLHRTRKPRSVA